MRSSELSRLRDASNAHGLRATDRAAQLSQVALYPLHSPAMALAQSSQGGIFHLGHWLRLCCSLQTGQVMVRSNPIGVMLRHAGVPDAR